MRSLAAVSCWLVATIALLVAIPANWAQRNLIDIDGYAAVAKSAAKDPALQDATTSLLTTQAIALADDRGFSPNETVVRGVVTGYVASPSFPAQFADVNRVAHRWLFTDAVQQDGDRWTIDVAPMLSNLSILETLGISVPPSVRVPVTSDTAQSLRPGELRPLATWGPWVSIGAAVVTALAALLTLALARRRGKAIVALGVSALLVGGIGWAGIEIGRRYIDDPLNQTTGDVRTIADVMVSNAEDSLHHWLNMTLAAGVVLVVLGAVIATLGALWVKRHRSSATETRTSAPI